MIKFFRRIRQQLLTENKFSKYLLYAIGEIALVMIGILLALQVNNWNDERKEKRHEIDILKQMKTDLEEDIQIGWKYPIYVREMSIKSSEIIINNLENYKPYHDSLDVSFAWIPATTIFMPRTSVYDNLKTVGFDVIDNNNLRNKYQQLFDFRYKLLELQFNEINIRIYNRFEDFYLDNFKEIEIQKNATPLDYAALSGNHKFLQMVKLNKKIKEQQLQLLAETKEEINYVINLIAQELNHKE